MRRNPERLARRGGGFSLLELVIVLAVLGFIAALAAPDWAAAAWSGHRRAAQAALLQASLHVHARRAAQGGLAEGDSLPEALSEVRAHGRVRYRLELLVAEDGHAFELRAVPQAPGAADICGTLSLNDVGLRRSASAPASTCWR